MSEPDSGALDDRCLRLLMVWGWGGRKPRDKLLDSLGVLTILAGKLERTEGMCREGKPG